jgi:hypothetical protein
MAWLSGWSYRVAVTVGTATGAGTDYQVKLPVIHSNSGTNTVTDVYLNNHCTSFPNDLDITKSDGTTELKFWIPNPTANPVTPWVKDADDLGAGNSTVYIYYGKSGQSTLIDFDNTFIFGDPFDNTTLNINRWGNGSTYNTTGNPIFTIDAVNHYLTVTDVDHPHAWDTDGYGFHSKTFTFPATYRIEDAYSENGFLMYQYSTLVTEVYGSRFNIHHTNTWTSADYGVAVAGFLDSTTGAISYYVEMGVGGNLDYDNYRGEGNPTMYPIIQKLADGNIYVYEGATLRVNEANSETPDRVNLGVTGYVGYGFGLERFGAFKIRKYVVPEPTISSVGTEETAVSLKEITDSFGISDSPLRNKTFSVADAFGLSDSTLRNKLFEILDSIGVADALNTPQRTLLKTDSFGVTDAALSNKILILIDSIGLTDMVLRSRIFAVFDSLGITDSILRNKIFEILDVFGLSDSARLPVWVPKVADSFGITDVILRDKVFGILDSFGLTEAVIVSRILEILDSIGLSETVLRGLNISVSDAFGLGDTIGTPTRTLIATESFGISDTPLCNKMFAVLDAIGLTDVLFRNKPITITDSMGLSEFLELLKTGIMLYVTDSFGLSDSILTDKTIKATDAFGVSDSILRSKVFTILDSLGLTDVPLMSKLLTVTDTLSFSELADALVVVILYKIKITIDELHSIKMTSEDAKTIKITGEDL